MTLNEAFELYKNLVLVNSSLRARKTEEGRWNRHLAPVAGVWQLEEIRPLKISILNSQLFGKELSPQTIYHCLSLLRRVLNRAVEWEIYPGPVPKIRMPKFDNRRIRFLSQDEAERLLDQLKITSPLWHDIALFALNTGLRCGEILAMTASQINLNAKVCTVKDSKTRLGRSVPLNDSALSVVHHYITVNRCVSVPIFNKNNRPINPYSRQFHLAVKKCGFNTGITDRRERVCFHTLRHTFASWLVQRGVQLQLVGQLLGHTTMKMTLRYAHLAPEQGIQAVMTLPKLSNSSSTSC